MKNSIICLLYIFLAKGTLKRAVMNQTWYCNNWRPSRYYWYVCSTSAHRSLCHKKHALISVHKWAPKIWKLHYPIYMYILSSLGWKYQADRTTSWFVSIKRLTQLQAFLKKCWFKGSSKSFKDDLNWKSPVHMTPGSCDSPAFRTWGSHESLVHRTQLDFLLIKISHSPELRHQNQFWIRIKTDFYLLCTSGHGLAGFRGQ